MPYDITTKDGITLRNIPDDVAPDSPQLRARVEKIRSGNFKPVSGKPEQPIQQDVSLADRVSNFGRGARAAITAPLVGINQRLGGANSQATSDAWREDMVATGSQPGGMGGQLVGGTATAAPLAMLPGANTVIGGGLYGLLQGASMPTAVGESTTDNMALAAGAGALIPAGIRLAKTGRAIAVDPFTEAGRNRISGNVLNRAAGDDAAAVAQRLATVRGNTPGFNLSASQAAGNDGISAFERTMRAIDPQAFQSLNQEQKSALVSALASIAKTPEDRAIAEQLRESAVKPLYDAAKKAIVTGDPALDSLMQRPSMQAATGRAANLAAERGDTFAASPAKKAVTQYIDEAGNVVNGVPDMPRQGPGTRNLLSELIQSGGISRSELSDMGIDAIAKTRPGLFRKSGTGKSADDLVEWMEGNGWLNARDIANADKYSAGGSHDLARSMVREAIEGKPVFHPSQDDIAYEFGDKLSQWGSQYGNLQKQTIPGAPATYSGKSLHDLKMGLDDAIGTPGIGGMQGAERGAALDTKAEFLKWLESKIPAYGQAKTTYADMSRPINQMDIGRELYNRFVPAIADQGGVPFKTGADAFSKALLRNGDQLAQTVTGLKNAKLASIMDPEQLALLQGVSKDAGTIAASMQAGKGSGSDTVQKIAMSNIAQEAGIPTWVGNMASVPGGWAKRIGDLLYGNADDQVRQRLAYLMTNPQEAAQAMNSAGATPSRIADLLKKGGQWGAMSLPPAMQALTAE